MKDVPSETGMKNLTPLETALVLFSLRQIQWEIEHDRGPYFMGLLGSEHFQEIPVIEVEKVQDPTFIDQLCEKINGP